MTAIRQSAPSFPLWPLPQTVHRAIAVDSGSLLRRPPHGCLLVSKMVRAGAMQPIGAGNLNQKPHGVDMCGRFTLAASPKALKDLFPLFDQGPRSRGTTSRRRKQCWRSGSFPRPPQPESVQLRWGSSKLGRRSENRLQLDQCPFRDSGFQACISWSVSPEPLLDRGRWVLRMEEGRGVKEETTVPHYPEGRKSLRVRWPVRPLGQR